MCPSGGDPLARPTDPPIRPDPSRGPSIAPTDGPSAAVSAALDGLRRVLESSGVKVVVTSIPEPGREAEHAAGRRAAAAALGSLGVPVSAPLGRHVDGRPVWPAGTTGSIAHTRDVAIAAAALVTSDTGPVERALGVDVELVAALPAADANVVLDATEQALVAAHESPDELATCLWSAKEAAYKAWHTATDGGLTLVDPVEIHIDIEDRPTTGELRAVRASATGRVATMSAPVGTLAGWCVATPSYVAVVVVAAARAATRGPHHGRDGIASAATTNPSAANATT